MESTRAEDISSSLSEILMSVSSDGNLASRTSSSQRSDCSISTSPRTRSAPSLVFCRRAYCTIAIALGVLRECAEAACRPWATWNPARGSSGRSYMIGIQLLSRNELHHLDFAAVLRGQRLQIGRGEHHGPAFLFVGLVDILVIHNRGADFALPLVTDAAPVLVVDLVETDIVVLRGAVELHGYVDQPERDRTLPYGPHALSQHHNKAEVKRWQPARRNA